MPHVREPEQRAQRYRVSGTVRRCGRCTAFIHSIAAQDRCSLVRFGFSGLLSGLLGLARHHFQIRPRPETRMQAAIVIFLAAIHLGTVSYNCAAIADWSQLQNYAR